MAQRKKAGKPARPAVKPAAAPVAGKAAPAAIAPQARERAAKLLQDATRAHIAKNLPEAERLYRAALAIEPNPAAIHNMGAALRDMKRPQEAAECFRQAIALRPDYADAHSNLGYCLLDLKEHDAAEASFTAAIKIAPSSVEAHCGRGSAYTLSRKFAEAEADFRAALALNPKHVQSINNFGHMLRGNQRYEDALALYTDAVKALPDDASLWSNYGGCYLDLHKLNEAVEALKKSIELAPTMAASHGNLGTIYVTLGKFDDAIACHRKALEIEPDEPKHYVNLGASLKEKGALGEAAASYSKAIALKPNYDYAVNNLGNLLREQGCIKDAIDCFRRAVAINPEYLVAQSNMLFSLNSLPSASVREIFEEHRKTGAQIEAAAELMPPPANNAAPERQLRIGYVSPDLLGHSVAYFIENLLEHHDKRNFHITCYALNKRLDSMSRRLQQRVDRWRSISAATDKQLCDQIRADGIDILVDLAGHTANHRLTAFARKPAPIQVTYLGYPNTSGLTTIDYRITDAIADPVGESDECHSEKLVRLPRGFLCFRPSDFAPEVAPRPVTRNGYVTFGSFNSLAKMDDGVVAAWARILHAVPNSRLILKSNSFNDPPTVELYRKRFGDHGIRADRLELMGRIAMIGDHLGAYGKIDIALDTFPYNGTTTTCEALWMGTPLITLAGDRHVGRVSQSILTQIGRTELIAHDVEDYVAKAVALANDPRRLAETSAQLRPDMLKSPVMDGPGFAHDVETAYREMWRNWCRSKGVQVEAPTAAPRPQTKRAEELVNEGTALFQSGDVANAAKKFQEATQLDPRIPEAHLNLGTCLKRLRRPLEAVEAYRKGLALRPDWASAYSNLGSALCDLGRQDEAEAACRKAIELDPKHRNAYSNLASVLSARRNDEEAVKYYAQAIDIGPPSAELYNNLAVALINLGRLSEAADACRKAIELQPNFAEAHANLASTLSSQGRINEAVEALRQVVVLKPDLQLAMSNLLFNLNYADNVTREQIFDEHRVWGDRIRALARNNHRNVIDPARRLRVGYVSADFCGHSVAFFFKPLIDRHDKSAVEVFCYSDVINRDIYTDMIKSAADHWRPTVGLPDEDVLKMIGEDQIDILVDLGGHTSKNRQIVFARKPAPIQVTWLGYPHSTGSPAIDYRLVDEVTDPQGEADRLAVERLYRIPGGFICYEPAPKTPDVSPLPASNNGYVTFCSFNNITKLGARTVRLWAKVLKAVPRSRMVLKSRSFADTPTRERYAQMFVKEGVTADRVQFLGWQPHLKSHLEIYQRIDIALDSYPYNGTTTTCEANWMGVPVVTLCGDRHAARVGASINTSLGLKNLIADSEDDFVAKAAALATDVVGLNDLRRSLRQRMRASRLCDGKVFAAEIEKFYRGAWTEWCMKASEASAATPRNVETSAAGDKRLRLLMKGGVEISLPYDLNLISPYVMLEQEDWFEAEAPFVRGLLQPGENVVDIGANYGVYSLISAKAVGSEGRVWSFEPASSTAEFLQESLSRNGFANAKVEQYALSDREGRAELALTGHAELNTLNAKQEGVKTESVRLRALDDWAQENGWPDVAFIKLDAEGEEPKVIRGADRLLREKTPIIMFEIRHGDRVNLALKDQFEQLGYKSYRLVPGLNTLAPFSGDQVDSYQLNLFCCKPDRAAALAARGLLVDGALPAPKVTAGRWRTEIAALNYASGRAAAWAAKLPDADNLARALDMYFHSRQESLSAAERLAALRHCYATLSQFVASKAPFAYLCTFARVASEFGARHAAAQALFQAKASVVKRDTDDSLPFLPPAARFDHLAPGEAFQDWSVAAVLETLDKLGHYSSFYSKNSEPDIEEVAKTGFQSAETERRRQLIRMRRGDQKAPWPSALLAKPGPDNLNISFWAPPRASGWQPQRLYDLIPNLPIINVVDIGAMIMTPTDKHPYEELVNMGRATVVGFEPNEAECVKLNRIGGQRRYYPYFIGDGGPATYYETNFTATGSLYPPNRALLDKFTSLPEYVMLKREHTGIRTRKLDDLAMLDGLEDIDYVKIDVQGAELDVFKNARRLLASATVVHSEVEFLPLYEGQPVFGDIDVFLRSQGYQLHTFDGFATRCFRPFRFPQSPNRGMRQILWTDAIYARDFLRLETLSTAKLLKMAVLMDSVFKSYDFAMMIVSVVDRRHGSKIAEDYARVLTPVQQAEAS